MLSVKVSSLCAVNGSEAAKAWRALRRGRTLKHLVTDATALLPCLILPLGRARWLLKDDHTVIPVLACVCLFCPGETQLQSGRRQVCRLAGSSCEQPGTPRRGHPECPVCCTEPGEGGARPGRWRGQLCPGCWRARARPGCCAGSGIVLCPSGTVSMLWHRLPASPAVHTVTCV